MDAKNIFIFISYSHHDKKWFNEDNVLFDLIPFLKRSLEDKMGVTFWYDRKKVGGIETGEAFKLKIEKSIDAADIAILLISQEFLNSKFIADVELKRIQDRYEEGQLQVFPILLEPCDWEEIAFISKLQIVPGKPTPLIEFTDSERKWVPVRYEILQSLKKKIYKIKRGLPIPDSNPEPEPGKEKTKYKKVRSILLITIPIIIGCIIAIIFFKKLGQSISKKQGSTDTVIVVSPPEDTSSTPHDSVEKEKDIPKGKLPGKPEESAIQTSTTSDVNIGTGKKTSFGEVNKPGKPDTENISNEPANGSFMDSRDKQEYKWVKIGDQIWMAENLNYATVNSSWCYDGKVDHCKVYGRLYSLETIKDLCPAGWHLPSENEWLKFIGFLGGEAVAGERMKGSSLWIKKNKKIIYNSFFNALPAGYRGCYDNADCENFHSMGYSTFWWSVPDSNDGNYKNWYIHNWSQKIWNYEPKDKRGVSVRCIKD